MDPPGGTAPLLVRISLRTPVTPRAGESTVGVHKRFCPGYGQVLNAQYLVGLWAASTPMCYPLAWRLLLPPEWFQDEARRARADVRGVDIPARLGIRDFTGRSYGGWNRHATLTSWRTRSRC
ncbi:conserved hypothetical protein [Streptomyces himastatinicus ATCC 53653]|uniref:Transposase IS701-like DDE domain-containing protein n=1 Tax=Streptomyces himastatinicus ATCC 53653 TaxID=457427 RepID=D9WTD6_9ACTN|nr:transposase [Streptomyces himastatinicus]EFL26357.1 conserved hypothetical protein [Streptomyces himastatinicus ATCC 53653]